MSLAIPYEDSLACTYPQLTVTSDVERSYRGRRQQRLVGNARDGKGLWIQYQQASIVCANIIQSLIISDIGDDMRSKELFLRNQLDHLASLIHIVQTFIRANDLHLVADVEGAHVQTFGREVAEVITLEDGSLVIGI